MGYYIESMSRFPGTNKEAKALIGKRIRYLRKCDIDHSGRGYLFPKVNTISDVVRRQVIFDNQDSEYISDIVEFEIIRDDKQEGTT